MLDNRFLFTDLQKTKKGIELYIYLCDPDEWSGHVRIQLSSGWSRQKFSWQCSKLKKTGYIIDNKWEHIFYNIIASC